MILRRDHIAGGVFVVGGVLVYALSGDLRYAHAVRQHIESWIEQCPVGRGANWASSLELAIANLEEVTDDERVAPIYRRV